MPWLTLELRVLYKNKRLGLAWLGLAWLGLAWLGLAWLANVKIGNLAKLKNFGT
jgi:hypothetical protein